MKIRCFNKYEDAMYKTSIVLSILGMVGGFLPNEQFIKYFVYIVVIDTFALIIPFYLLIILIFGKNK